MFCRYYMRLMVVVYLVHIVSLERDITACSSQNTHTSVSQARQISKAKYMDHKLIRL